MTSRAMNDSIRQQISIALKDLGADEKLLSKLNSMSVDELYDAAERLKAEPMLLGFIGSWQDTLSDTEVFIELQQWNWETAVSRQQEA
jgi:hypothetical protein